LLSVGLFFEGNKRMSFWELMVIAVALSMDAFAVAVCKGLSVKEYSIKHSFVAGGYFGTFQALMPLIGYLLGTQFAAHIIQFDHWIAFVLLSIIGINMIRESRCCTVSDASCSFGFKRMTILSLATSIDALAIGVTFAFLKVSIVPAVITIGITTFAISFVGVKIGSVFGVKYKSKAELAGGIILILMGIKILLEHLGIIHF